MTTQSEKEFEVLGYKLRYRPDASTELSANVLADEVVAFITNRADSLKQQYPHLNNGQVATLLALDLAKEKFAMQREFKADLQRLEDRANHALKLIEEASPPAQ